MVRYCNMNENKDCDICPYKNKIGNFIKFFNAIRRDIIQNKTDKDCSIIRNMRK